MKRGLLIFLAACGGTTAVGDDDGDDDVVVAVDAAVAPELVACDDALEDVWVTPPLADAVRGDVLRCAPGIATTGAQLLKIAYLTVRSSGAPAVTTATVWLPDEPRAHPAPIALVARSTSGIADACAPSREDNPLADLALPLAARGFVVIAPDFAGLGNEGVHAYLDEHEAAAQLFDGALALAHLVPAEELGEPEIALGYSQGGGIVLTAQALEHELTGRRTLKAVTAMAPEWPIRDGSFGYESVLRNPEQATGLAGLSPPTVTVLRHYGWLVNHLGEASGGDSFPAAEREALIEEIESDCTVELGGALDVNQPHLSDLVDESFRLAMLACIDGTDGCVEPAASFHAWMRADRVTADPDGADVLVIQGLGDQVMPAASEAACDVAKLRADGVEPTICSDTFATHASILGSQIGHAVSWLEAAVDGAPRPVCASSYLPSCTP